MSTERWSLGFHEVVNASYKIRQEIETAGIKTFTPYVPTNWDVEDDEILDGWKEESGVCEKCFTLRALNGACNC